MSAIRLLIAVGLLLPVSGVDRRYADQNGNPVLDRCLIKLKGEDEIRIPAQVSGVLISMPVKEGSRVAKGDLLATIDDREARAACGAPVRPIPEPRRSARRVSRPARTPHSPRSRPS